MDFANFFPSLGKEDVKFIITNNYSKVADLVSTTSDLDVITQIVCRFGLLTIGAPTSPLLSNRIMASFDAYWLSFSRDRDVTYTRYADDLFFSCNRPNILSEFQATMAGYLAEQPNPTVRINSGKISFSSKK